MRSRFTDDSRRSTRRMRRLRRIARGPDAGAREMAAGTEETRPECYQLEHDFQHEHGQHRLVEQV